MFRNMIAMMVVVSAFALTGCSKCSEQPAAEAPATEAPAADAAPEAAPADAAPAADAAPEAAPEATPAAQ